MTTTIESQERPKVEMKGTMVGAMVHEGSSICQLWFRSPTGGQTDSQIFEMHCESHEQAKVIAEQHRSVWGL